MWLNFSVTMHFSLICSTTFLTAYFSLPLYGLIEKFIKIIVDSHAIVRNNTSIISVFN